MKRPRPTTRRPRPRPKHKEESRKLREARTRVAVEYAPMRFTRKRKWVPAENTDGAERAPSWSKYRRRTRTVEEVREAVRRELEDTEGER